MARKEEVKIIHPRDALKAVTGFVDDVGVLMSAARNAHRFLTDDSLDAEKVRKAIAPILSEAIARVEKWYEAD